jgi:outer membrane protein TolC
MNRSRLLRFLLLTCTAVSARSQDFVKNYWHTRFNASDIQVRPVEGLEERIMDGKLHLRIRDFLSLVLHNSPDIQITLLNSYNAEDALLGARAPFDPALNLSFNTLRQVSSIAGGEGFIFPQTVSSLNQQSLISYQQLLPTGQTIQANFTADRSSGDGYNFPTLFGSLNFLFTQPLLQNRTNLQFLTPLRIARTEILITAKQNAATINNALEQVALNYWDAVLARDNIHVSEQSLDLAKKSYNHDKLALDLGAISKLQILQSESSVADRERALIQAQYDYKVVLDGLRRSIGADLTPRMRDTEIVLDDDPSDLPDKTTILPFEEALTKALQNRPEVEIAAGNLRIDELTAKASRDQLLPVVNLQAQGGSSGPLFNQLSAGGVVGQVSSVPPPGLGTTLQQILQFQAPLYGASITATFPFHNPAAQQSLADALVSRAKNRYLQRQTQEQITLEVRQAVHRIELADATIKAAIRARDLLRQNADAEQQRYQLGDIQPFELLTSQNALANGESALNSAYVNYQEAYIDYQRATQTLLTTYGMILKTP